MLVQQVMTSCRYFPWFRDIVLRDTLHGRPVKPVQVARMVDSIVFANIADLPRATNGYRSGFVAACSAQLGFGSITHYRHFHIHCLSLDGKATSDTAHSNQRPLWDVIESYPNHVIEGIVEENEYRGLGDLYYLFQYRAFVPGWILKVR